MVCTECGDIEGLEMILVPLANSEGAKFGESSCNIFRSIHVKDSSWYGQFSGANPKAPDH